MPAGAQARGMQDTEKGFRRRSWEGEGRVLGEEARHRMELRRMDRMGGLADKRGAEKEN